ncbi:MAG: TonB family protein [Gammaproteobacteria bacterium]|jgi:TonB family protein
MSAALEWLANTALSLGLVLTVILLLRRTVGRWLGAETAYRLWLLVPLHLAVATFLQASPTPGVVLAPFTLHTTLPLEPLASGSGSTAGLLIIAWSAVAGYLLWRLAWGIAIARTWINGSTPGRDRHFPGPVLINTRLNSPVVAGLLRPVLLLPADFPKRYTAEERRLVLSHEAVHLRRKDNLVIALARLVQALFWFNPLVHVAIRAFRADQELSCDALVLREAGPGKRKAYGRALVKTAATTEPVAVASTWHSHKQLKERTMMLKSHRRTLARSISGLILLASLSLGAGALSVNAFAHDTGKIDHGPTPVTHTQPTYPRAALERHIQGKVVMQFTVNARGRVEDVKVVKSQPQGVFDQAAVTAIKQWTFRPATRNGKAVPVQTRQIIRFQLDSPSK